MELTANLLLIIITLSSQFKVNLKTIAIKLFQKEILFNITKKKLKMNLTYKMKPVMNLYQLVH